jgi:hypothetical protein
MKKVTGGSLEVREASIFLFQTLDCLVALGIPFDRWCCFQEDVLVCWFRDATEEIPQTKDCSSEH